MENIVLIGFSGTGKTTTGKILADRLGKKFVDIDQEIEKICGMSVEEIFRIHGEMYFRSKERLAIQHMLHIQNAVIATGGGAVLSPDNVVDMKNYGVVVSLQAKAEVILERIEKDPVARPLLQKPDRLQIINDMIRDRTERYQVADFAVETNACSAREVAENIIDALVVRGFLNRNVN